VERVKQALFGGGIARANKPDGVRNTPGIQVRCWEAQAALRVSEWAILA
jgi:hypothetical protein